MKNQLLPLFCTDFEGEVHRYDFPAADYRQIDAEYKGYFKFAIVRNPWSRLVSCYKDKARIRTGKHYTNGTNNGFLKYDGLLYGGMPFDEFAEAVCTIPDSEADVHFRSQLFSLINNYGEFLPDYIGRLENLSVATGDIYGHTGLSFEGMKRVNSSKNTKPYTEYYTETLKEKVRARFAADVEAFGYQFSSNEELEPIGLVGTAFRESIRNSDYFPYLLKEKTRALEMRAVGLEKHVSNLEARLDMQEKERQILKNSLSWKITSPLRMVANAIKTNP